MNKTDIQYLNYYANHFLGVTKFFKFSKDFDAILRFVSLSDKKTDFGYYSFYQTQEYFFRNKHDFEKVFNAAMINSYLTDEFYYYTKFVELCSDCWDFFMTEILQEASNNKESLLYEFIKIYGEAHSQFILVKLYLLSKDRNAFIKNFTFFISYNFLVSTKYNQVTNLNYNLAFPDRETSNNEWIELVIDCIDIFNETKLESQVITNFCAKIVSFFDTKNYKVNRNSGIFNIFLETDSKLKVLREKTNFFDFILNLDNSRISKDCKSLDQIFNFKGTLQSLDKQCNSFIYFKYLDFFNSDIIPYCVNFCNLRWFVYNFKPEVGKKVINYFNGNFLLKVRAKKIEVNETIFRSLVSLHFRPKIFHKKSSK